MAILKSAPHHSTKQFTYSKTGNSFICEESDFGKQTYFGQIYDDSADEGFWLVSQKTGTESLSLSIGLIITMTAKSSATNIAKSIQSPVEWFSTVSEFASSTTKVSKMIETKTGIILSSIDTSRVETLCDQELLRMYIKEKELKFAYPDFVFGMHEGAPHFTMKSHISGRFFAMKMVRETEEAYVFKATNGLDMHKVWEVFIVK